VVEAAEPLLGSDQRRGLAIIDRELDNIRVALRCSIETDELEPGASICGALFVYWYLRGRYEEGRRWCDPLIDRGATLDARLLGPVLFADGYLATVAGNVERGGELMAHATATAIECGDTKTEARARGLAAQMAAVIDGSREAVEELRRICELSRQAGDAWNETDNWTFLAAFERLLFGVVGAAATLAEAEREATRAGDVDHAATAAALRLLVDLFGGDVRTACESLLPTTDTLSDLGQTHIGGIALVGGALAAVWSGDGAAARVLAGEAAGEGTGTIAEGLTHWPQGLVAMAEGKTAEARRLISEARSEWVCIMWRALILVDLADACVLDGDLDEAGARLDEALGIAVQLGNPYDEGRALAGLARLARAREDDARAEALFHDALRLHVTAEDRMAIATTLESLAAMSNHEAAARLYGAAFTMRESMGYRWAMPSHAFEGETGWVEGLALAVDDAIAYAQRGRGERKRAATGWSSLTPTELKVVDLVAEGLTNAQLAERMFIAVGTAKTHLTHVFAKLGVTTRAQLATLATKRKSDS
jgi:DNA-binding CsgD family transcriptional regulator